MPIKISSQQDSIYFWIIYLINFKLPFANSYTIKMHYKYTFKIAPEDIVFYIVLIYQLTKSIRGVRSTITNIWKQLIKNMALIQFLLSQLIKRNTSIIPFIVITKIFPVIWWSLQHCCRTLITVIVIKMWNLHVATIHYVHNLWLSMIRVYL